MAQWIYYLAYDFNQCLQHFLISGTSIDIDTHDLLTRYTNDVIATCVFGIQSDSFAEKDNTIYKMAGKLTTFKFIVILKIFISSAIPAINKVRVT